MTGSREEAALGQVGAICGLACCDQLGRDPLVIGDVANRRGDESSATIADRAQADLDREFGAIAPARKQLEAGAHRAYLLVGGEALPMEGVSCPESLWQQQVHIETDDLLRLVAENSTNLLI